VQELAGFFDVENFASFIVTALGTGAMRHFLFVTVGALGKAVAFERVVSPPGRGAFLRMASFWIRHVLNSFEAFSSQPSALSEKT